MNTFSLVQNLHFAVRFGGFAPLTTLKSLYANCIILGVVIVLVASLVALAEKLDVDAAIFLTNTQHHRVDNWLELTLENRRAFIRLDGDV